MPSVSRFKLSMHVQFRFAQPSKDPTIVAVGRALQAVQDGQPHLQVACTGISLGKLDTHTCINDLLGYRLICVYVYCVVHLTVIPGSERNLQRARASSCYCVIIPWLW